MRTQFIATLCGAVLLSLSGAAFAAEAEVLDAEPGQQLFREYIFVQDENLGKAISALIQSAQKGYVPALNALGDIYQQGRLLPRFTRAFGNPFPEQDLRVKVDAEAAAFWYRLASDAEAPSFDPEVACYLHSKSALYAEKETYMQLRAAAELGDTLAQIYITSLNDEMAADEARDGKTSAGELDGECGFVDDTQSENASYATESRASFDM